MMRILRVALTTLVLPICFAWALTHYLHRTLYRHDALVEHVVENDYGPVGITLQLPGTHSGIAEPLLACGEMGRATLAYLKNMPDGKLRVGVEFWSKGAFQGEEFSVAKPDAVIHLVCFFPALFPEVGDPAWGGVPLELQRIRRTRYYIVVDGVVRLSGTTDYVQPPHPRLYFAANPLGGSLVSDRLTGTVISAAQRFLR